MLALLHGGFEILNMKFFFGNTGAIKTGFTRTLLNSSMMAFLIIISGCSGKSDVRPFDVESDAFSELHAAVRNAIDDPEREARALAIADEFGEEMLSLMRLKVDRQTQFKKLNANYDTTRAEFNAFVRESNEDIRRNQQRVVKQREAFIEVTTPDEWALIFEVREKIINNALESIQST